MKLKKQIFIYVSIVINLFEVKNMDWAEVVEHPSLQDIPFKIETNEFGEIVMNPVKINHSFYQSRISTLMQNMRQDGVTLTECAVRTRLGTKCADVAWVSLRKFADLVGKVEADFAPEVCVEVVSGSNTKLEMKNKRKLYFERGAKEVWICNEKGELEFYTENKRLGKSVIFPEFSNKINIKAAS